MTAMQEMMAYLRKSPSLVYPADVLEYAVRAEEESERLQVALSETLVRLSAANEAAGGRFMDAGYCELLHGMGIEV